MSRQAGHAAVNVPLHHIIPIPRSGALRKKKKKKKNARSDLESHFHCRLSNIAHTHTHADTPRPRISSLSCSSRAVSGCSLYSAMVNSLGTGGSSLIHPSLSFLYQLVESSLLPPPLPLPSSSSSSSSVFLL